MAPRSSRIVWHKDEISGNLRKLAVQLPAGLRAIMEYQSPEVQNYARANAPWTDRTSNARNGLFAQPFDEGARFGIVLYGSVSYQIWLETRFSGTYSIILPTIEAKGPDVMRMVNKLLGRL